MEFQEFSFETTCCPVKERCCSSMATTRDGRCYDGTMRVTFALRRRMGASEALTPEDIEVDWLGGYWKLPYADMMLGWQRRQPQMYMKVTVVIFDPQTLVACFG